MRFKRLLGIILSLVMVISFLPLQVVADEIADALKCRSVSEASYSVQENLITEWPGHANIEIVFTNTGDEPIFNWNYSFEFIYNIESPYNCTVLEHEGDLYTVGNSSWNKDIYPGESVTVGFTASSNDGSDIEYMPSFYLLNNAKTILPEGSLSVEYVEYSDWTSGSSGAIVLTNNTDESIKSWEISFAANRPITDAYNVTLITNEDGTYTITGDSYSEIPAGGTYQFGIQCGEHDSGIPFEITGLTVSSSTLALGLTEDQNGNGVPDVAETDYTGIVPTVTPDITDTPAPTTTEEPITTVEPTVTETPTDTPEPTPTEFVFTPDQDLDGDGLYTSEEEMYGTDPNNPDTDGDGVSDGKEVQMMYFPTVADSDYNGVLDGDEDYDGDGIINRDEETYGTCPYAADSDYDGINDYDEIFTYSTDPYEEDSDGDYILDGDELALGLDPTTDMTESVQDNENTEDYSFATTSEQIVEYNTDDQPFSFSFDITAAGRVDKYIKVQETGYKYAIEDNSTILGRSPEIVYDYAMKVDSVTTKFTLKNGYEADIDKYCIFYYWEGYNILIPIETEYDYDSGTVYATNTMIGTYCLVDTELMYELLGINEDGTEGKNNSKKYLKSEAEKDSNPTYPVSDAKVYNGHVYFLITSDTPMLYDEAVAACAQYGGYPAVITSAEENAFLESITNSGWIGGRVKFHGISTPTVEWITGEDCTFTYWAFGSYNANDFPQWEGFPLTFGGVWGWKWRDPDTYTEKSVICECEITGKSVSALTFGEENIELNCYSDSDIDGAGLLDYQELSCSDLGTFDESTGIYNAATLLDYYVIAETLGMSINANVRKKLEKCTVSSFKSDPFSIDRDGDNYQDNEDVTPYKSNEDLIIILVCSDDADNTDDANKLYDKYRRLKYNCQMWEFCGYDSFMQCWSIIGEPKKSFPFCSLQESVYNELYSGKYYYNVTDVVLICHCASDGVVASIGDGEYLCPEYSVEVEFALKSDPESSYFHFISDIKTCLAFDSLALLICDSAMKVNLNDPDNWVNKNMAQTFISSFPSIKYVFAFDCNCGLSDASGEISWVGTLKMVDYPNLEECGYSGQVLYFRNTSGGAYGFVDDLYEGNIDIFFEGSPFRAEINAKENDYFDPVFYVKEYG